MIQFLTNANEQKKIAVKKKLQEDPNFFSELKHGAYMKILSDIKSQETAEQAAEQSVFADIEAELANL